MLSLRKQTGDTIIEVLIAIMIAGLAIGTSYSIASKSIQRAISARERDSAVGVLESQISALKLRQQKTDSAAFAARFTYPTTHFCLIDSASDPTAATWLPQANLAAAPLAAPSAGAPTSSQPYDPDCVKSGTYYMDITTAQDPTSSTPTNYQLTVRWPRIGGGADNVTTFYYRF